MSPRAIVRLLGVVAMIGLTVAWLAVAQPEPAAAPPAAIDLSAQGVLRVANSRAGRSIFHAANLRPGRRIVGTVALTNRSRSRVSMTLSKRRVRNVPGRYGGRLSNRLQLAVEEVSRRPVRRVYRGALAAMRPIQLKPFAPREHRRYRFVVRLPNGGLPSSNATGDNRFQGSRVSVDYQWRMVGR